MSRFYLLSLLSLFLVLGGCVDSTANMALDKNIQQSQVELRQIQSRVFDKTDRQSILRNIIATLQDLGFVLDKADATLGMVSATKFSHQLPFKMTVSLRPKGEKQWLVRANAQYGLSPVTEVVIYQDFFNSLSKAMFLANEKVV